MFGVGCYHALVCPERTATGRVRDDAARRSMQRCARIAEECRCATVDTRIVGKAAAMSVVSAVAVY